MRMRRPRVFGLFSLICAVLCVGFALLWMRSRQVKVAAVPSTYYVQAQLARALPQGYFQNGSLKDVLDFLRDLSGQPMEVDWATLESGGITRDALINQKFTNVRLGELEASILASAGTGAQFRADAKGISITMKGAPWREQPANPPWNPPDPIRAWQIKNGFITV